MNIINRTTGKIFLAAALSAITALQVNAGENQLTSSVTLLTATFEARQVAQVEVGDFHFLPGQIAPIHTHTAPAVGYVAKGMIIYQVEGGKPQILREGDAFYEPAGPRILRFDNASATEEAIFLDFNLEQAGEPFIIAKAGKPLVKVEALKQDPVGTSRLGFLDDMAVPEDFDQMGGDDIAGMFET